MFAIIFICIFSIKKTAADSNLNGDAKCQICT